MLKQINKFGKGRRAVKGLASLLLGVSILAGGCGKLARDNKTQNSPSRIERLTASPSRAGVGERVTLRGKINGDVKFAYVDVDTKVDSGSHNVMNTDPSANFVIPNNVLERIDNNTDIIFIPEDGGFAVEIPGYWNEGMKEIKVGIVDGRNNLNEARIKINVDRNYNPVVEDDDDDNDDVIPTGCGLNSDCADDSCVGFYVEYCDAYGTSTTFNNDGVLSAFTFEVETVNNCIEGVCENNVANCYLPVIIEDDSILCDVPYCVVDSDCGDSSCDVEYFEPCIGTTYPDINRNTFRDLFPISVTGFEDNDCLYGNCETDVADCAVNFDEVEYRVQIGSCGAECIDNNLLFCPPVTGPYETQCIENVCSNIFTGVCEDDEICADDNVLTRNECVNYGCLITETFECWGDFQCAPNEEPAYFSDVCTGPTGNHVLDVNGDGEFNGETILASCDNECDYPEGVTDAGYCSDCYPSASTPTTLEQCLPPLCGANCDEASDCLGNNNDCDETYNDFCIDNTLVDFNNNRLMDSYTRSNTFVSDCENCICEIGEADCDVTPTYVENATQCVTIGCESDDGCNLLDSDYCSGDNLMHDEGRCVVGECEPESSLTENCDSNNDYCAGDAIWNSQGYCNASTTPICDTLDSLVEDCDVSENYCAGDEVWNSDGYCNDVTSTIVCDSNNNFVEGCNDDLYCNGQETCEAGDCQGGENIVCSANDLDEINTCNNIPDGNALTRDYAEGFVSSCDEDADGCTTYTQNVTSVCDYTCGADCLEGMLCEPTECDTFDGCVGENYIDYSDVENGCSDCGCEVNECLDYQIFVDDARCVIPECVNDDDCLESVCYAEYAEPCNDDSTFPDIDGNGVRSYPAVVSESVPNTCEIGSCTSNPVDCVPNWDEIYNISQVGECGANCAVNDDCENDYYSATLEDYCDGNNLVDYDWNGIMNSSFYEDFVENTCDSGVCSGDEANRVVTPDYVLNHADCVDPAVNNEIEARGIIRQAFDDSGLGYTINNDGSYSDLFGFGVVPVDERYSVDVGVGQCDVEFNYLGYPEACMDVPDWTSEDRNNVVDYNSWVNTLPGGFAPLSVVEPNYSNLSSVDALYDCATAQIIYCDTLGDIDTRDDDCE